MTPFRKKIKNRQIDYRRCFFLDTIFVIFRYINVGGKNHWLHTVSNDDWTLFFAHKKRGSEAMDEMGILPFFTGVLCHDHWKPYFGYDCSHSLCNAHHLRELERAIEQDDCKWAAEMKAFLIKVS